MPTDTLSRRPAPVRLAWLYPMRPCRLDSYILGEVIRPFLGGILFLIFIFLMFQILRIVDLFVVHDVPFAILAKMVGLLMLSFLPAALPVAFLVGVLIGFGRLSTDSEIVAIKACGISIARLALPISCLALVVVGFSLALNMEWVPRGDRLFKSTQTKVSNTKAVSVIREGTFTSDFFDLLIYADKVDPKTNQMQRVFIFDEREAKTPLVVVAKAGEIVTLRPSKELGASAMLRLKQGNIHRNDLEADTYQKMDFKEYRLYLNVDEGVDTSNVKPRMLPYKDLLANISLQDPKSPFKRELQAEFWRRYAVAFSPLIFVFLGIGFGTMRTRAVRSGAALITILVVALYWGLQAFGNIAAQKDLISPFLAMQLPNLIALVVAVRAFRSATW